MESFLIKDALRARLVRALELKIKRNDLTALTLSIAGAIIAVIAVRLFEQVKYSIVKPILDTDRCNDYFGCNTSL